MSTTPTCDLTVPAHAFQPVPVIVGDELVEVFCAECGETSETTAPLFDEDSPEYGYPETGSWTDRYDTAAEWRGER